jgi:hypothetical protein
MFTDNRSAVLIVIENNIPMVDDAHSELTEVTEYYIGLIVLSISVIDVQICSKIHTSVKV